MLTAEARVEPVGAQGRLGVAAIRPVVRAFQSLVGSDGVSAAVRTRHRQELVGDETATLSAVPDESSAQRLHAVGVRAELIQALGTLPPRQRAVLVLRYFEDLSEAQAAEILGCSVGTVKSTASRGLTRLEAALSPDLSLSTKEPAP